MSPSPFWVKSRVEVGPRRCDIADRAVLVRGALVVMMRFLIGALESGREMDGLETVSGPGGVRSVRVELVERNVGRRLER